MNRQFRDAAVRLLLVCVTLAMLLAGGASAAHAAEPLLPNLVADPPANISLETSTTEGGLKKEAPPELLLRFNGYLHNTGPGALDFRGSRKSPSEAMKAFQRVYNSDGTFKEEPSSAELIYVTADGHEHWHLQRAAKYSLWNLAKSAEVAPAMKVGFCLDDSEHVEPSIGPKEAVYSDANGCANSAGSTARSDEPVRGRLGRLARPLQLEPVLPVGRCLERAAGRILAARGRQPTRRDQRSRRREHADLYDLAVVIPGFDAAAQSTSTHVGEAHAVTLTSTAYKDATTPKYAIVSGPAHGTLGTVSGNQVTYTPTAGYSGPDSFTFSAADPNSPFPRSPAVATVSIEVGGTGGGSGLLAGDATATYTVADQTTAGREEAFQFTAKSSGTVEELQFRTNATANTGVTGLVLGMLAENAGKPGAVISAASVTGTPATSSWIKASGLSAPVIAGTKYWLVALPLGPSSAKLHYSVAAGSGGTGNVESTTGALTAMTAESSWETFNQGPVGFQAIGSTGAAEPSVTIEGAPASMLAGTSVQLKAKVTNDSATVKWAASAGTISAEGLYTAPAEPPAGGNATITATTVKGAKAQVTIQVASAEPSVTIEGAPASMIAGTSVQLKDTVVNDSPTVKWTASAGTITAEGLYTAPGEPPAGGRVTITVTTVKGAKAEITILINAPAEPSVTIEGAPASMTAGSSVQLKDKVENDSATVKWAASAGTITAEGLYTAPAAPPAGGKATITVTTVKGAKAEATIEILAAVSKGLLAGDATATYTVADQTTAGREEAFQFTAKSSGTVEELQFRTNATANTGVTGLVLGVLAENAGAPGAVLAASSVSGLPATSSWIKAGGLSLSLVSGTKYWLVALPLGPSSAKLHYNAAVGSGGAGNVESKTGALTAMTAESSWETYNQGPVGFQAIGTTGVAASRIGAGTAHAASARALLRASSARVHRARRPARAARARAGVAIEGAAASIIAGTSVQLAATGPPVSWSASAGTISADGLYTAPSSVTRARRVHIVARRGRARDARTITVLPVPVARPAPAAQLQSTGPGAPAARAAAAAGLALPQALIVGPQLVLSTTAGRAGVVALSAHIGARSLGSCSARTPGHRGFTCRLKLAGVSAYASIGVRATLRTHGRTLASVRAPAPVAAMSMPSTLAVSLLLKNGVSAAQFICSPGALAAALPGVS